MVITSELANQHAQKVLLTYVVLHTNNCYWPPELKKFCTAYQSIGHCLHAHIEIHEVLVVASRVINTHLRLYAKQKAVAITYREIKNTDKVVN